MRPMDFTTTKSSMASWGKITSPRMRSWTTVVPSSGTRKRSAPAVAVEAPVPAEAVVAGGGVVLGAGVDLLAGAVAGVERARRPQRVDGGRA